MTRRGNERELSTDKPRPECLSILVCANIRLVHHKKLDVLGVINAFTARQFPFGVKGPIVLCTLTGGKGRYEVSLTIEHDASGREIYREEARKPLMMGHRDQVQDAFFVIEHITFYAAGRYTIKVYVDDQLIARRPIMIYLGERSKEA